MQKRHSKQTEKDTCLQHKSWNKKAECRLVRLSWGHACVLGDSSFLLLCMPLEALQILIWGCKYILASRQILKDRIYE